MIKVQNHWNVDTSSSLLAIVHLINDTHQVVSLDVDDSVDTVWFQGNYNECRMWLNDNEHTAWLE